MTSLSEAWDCISPTVQQGAYLSSPILASCLAIRLLVFLPVHRLVHECVASALGLYVVWWYFEASLVYLLVLIALVYALLLIVPQDKRGLVVGGACVLYSVIWYIYCTLFCTFLWLYNSVYMYIT